MRGELAVQLSAVPESCWIVASYGDEAGMVRWLPLVQVSHTGIWLGVSRYGSWILGRLDEVVDSTSEHLPASWVTMLDSDEVAVRARLTSAAEKFNLSAETLQRLLPVEEVLELAIKSQSPHWVARAVQWMAERGITEEQAPMLREVIGGKWADQKTRHAAWRLVKVFERPKR